ncbi:protein 4.1-like isoform X2 [Mya arenaria]|uniref:protein 4.1-like isoform X2 n=1 Tax=Mya arenaria TaxID=6604 RepID=UPI0022DF6DFB|nr:protein 4.1-like isoform X2 [Mya arenaria]
MEPEPQPRKIMAVRSARQVPVRVRLLDDDTFNDSVDKRGIGWVLFDKVCEHLNIIEKDYFGLNYKTADGEQNWLNNDKKIAKQMKGQNWNFSFEVKFYPADPAQLAEDLTRYQLCLQIRRDIVNEKLPCSFVTYTLLGSYTAQSELGDYDPEEFGSGYKYLKDIQFAPHQDKELLIKIAELHRQHKGQTPEESELKFLENAKKLALYGVELHPAKDAEGKDIQLGVCAQGLLVYKDKQQVNRFVWPKVLKMSYRRNKFFIKIRPGEFEEFASLIGFKLLNIKYSKRLWKICVEHHSFFRFREPEPTKHVSLLPRFGSRFRYSGRTQFQSRQFVSEEGRDAPFFDRVLSKRGTFGGRTDNMRKRQQDGQRQREQMRKTGPPPKNQQHPLDAPAPSPRQQRPPSPKEDHRDTSLPEPKHAPPVAPKPKPAVKPKPYPRGSQDSLDKLDEGNRSMNDSFDDVPDRRSRMEKMHAVATPLAAIMQKGIDRKREEDERERRSLDRYSDDENIRSVTPEPEERDSRPMTPEVIDQHIAPDPQTSRPMSAKDKKAFAKQEKDRIKHEKEEAKRRKKAEDLERKRMEKERKAALAEDKKAAKHKTSSKGRDFRDPEREVRDRLDSRGSNDIGRGWNEAREHEGHAPATPDRKMKRLSSFEDVKREADHDRDQPPTPPAPLHAGHRSRHSESDGSEFDSAEEQKGADRHGDEDAEEVSF